MSSTIVSIQKIQHIVLYTTRFEKRTKTCQNSKEEKIFGTVQSTAVFSTSFGTTTS